MKVLPNKPIDHTPMAPRAKGELRVGQMNAYNLFDTKDDPSKQDPVLEPAAYKAHVGKLAVAIRDALGAPDIITMQEVENTKVLKDLVNHPAIRALGYTPLLHEGTDPRGIDNAILYRDTVKLTQVMQLDPLAIGESGRAAHLFTRPPLVAKFALTGAGEAARGLKEITVIANHFTSKLGQEDAARKRGEQAKLVANLAQGLQAIDPKAAVLVAGDLNMERSEPEFAALRKTVEGAALVDVTATIPSAERYSWRDGRKHLQLDHFLASTALSKRLSTIEIPHVSTRIEKGAASDPVRAEGFSDHDPIVATFNA